MLTSPEGCQIHCMGRYKCDRDATNSEYHPYIQKQSSHLYPTPTVGRDDGGGDGTRHAHTTMVRLHVEHLFNIKIKIKIKIAGNSAQEILMSSQKRVGIDSIHASASLIKIKVAFLTHFRHRPRI